jgi:hypothetical protein
MKFTLTYEGELGSDKASQKWLLRKAFHPQLAELWSVNRALRNVKHLQVPHKKGWYLQGENHHSIDPQLGDHDPPLAEFTPNSNLTENRNVCFQIQRHGWRYLPLVRESLALICGLDILFLRKEEPGALVKQGGDLDNRIKTLFDGLRMPSKGDPAYDGAEPLEQPFYCLLEEDSLISQMNVETGRLLTRPGGNASEVKLIVTVTVKAAHVRSYNLPLIGD